MAAMAAAGPASVETGINFVIPGEKVVFYPTDRKRSYMPFEEHRVRIEDARPHADALSLEKNGFALIERPTAVKNFYDDEEVQRVYYPETEALVKEITGAEKVIIVNHVARTDNPAAKDGNLPSFGAHCDYGDFTTREFAENFLGKEEAAKWLSRRYLFMNLWRPITTVERSPLALCDPTTVDPKDLYGSEVRGGLLDPNRPPLYGFNLAHADGQRWFYAPRMRPDEIWAFKIHESDPDRVGGVVHSAFNDPTASPDAPPRESIEIRTISFFPE